MKIDYFVFFTLLKRILISGHKEIVLLSREGADVVATLICLVNGLAKARPWT
jgi:hypothetical protein